MKKNIILILKKYKIYRDPCLKTPSICSTIDRRLSAGSFGISFCPSKWLIISLAVCESKIRSHQEGHLKKKKYIHMYINTYLRYVLKSNDNIKHED